MSGNGSAPVRVTWLRPRNDDDIRYLLRGSSDKHGFEGRDAARRENAYRVARLDAYAREYPEAESSQQAIDVARRIEKSQGLMPEVSTFASALSTRQHRRGFCGAVLAALRETASEVALFTVVPNRDWLISQSELSTVNPKNLLERFRQQLVRTGLKCGQGWIIAALHGEYSIETTAYQLHIHLLAVGGAISIVENLRRLPMYRASDGEKAGDVHRPIVRRRLADPARQISYYLAQGFWPMKPTYLREGKVCRSRERRRLPPPCLVEFLMWIDRQSFKDLVLLYGCRITKGRLHRSGHSG